jgi:hypothetical protein
MPQFLGIAPRLGQYGPVGRLHGWGHLTHVRSIRKRRAGRKRFFASDGAQMHADEKKNKTEMRFLS